MIDFKCPGCTKAFSLSNTFAGSKVKCPKCDTVFRVPGLASRAKPNESEHAPLPAKSNARSPAASGVQGEQGPNVNRKPKTYSKGPGAPVKIGVIATGAVLGLLILSCAGVAVVIILLRPTDGTTGAGSPSRTDSASAGKSGALSATDLCEEFRDANKIAVHEKYLDKTLKVTGKIREVEERGDICFLTLEPFVVCLFDINQRSELARLHKGDTVVVQGICKSHFVTPKGHIWDIEPMLTYCELATQKPTASTKTGPPQAKPTMPPTSSRPPSNRPAPDPVVRRPLPPASSKAQDQLPLGRVSANDLEATSHRVRYLLEKMNSEIREARDKNKYSPTGNAIRDKEAEQKQSEAILKAEQSGKGKIEEEFNMLIGKTLEWNWPVSKVEEVGGGKFSINLDYKHVALVRDRQMMNVGIGLGSLIAGEEIPEDTAKQLNPGDRVLIKGKVDAIRAMYFENAYGSQEKFFRIQVLILLSDMTAERGARGK